MMAYMTELDMVDIDEDKEPAEAEVSGEDLSSLLYQFLEEVLFLFVTEFYVFKKVTITEWQAKGDSFRLKFKAYGEEFDLSKHPQGTEIKAITYSAMQVIPPEKNTKNPNRAELWVIVDI